jgi:ParB family transcriptional regulator, chromosome partitioning protein
MTEQQDNDVDSDIPTAADAKRQWKERIAELREGDKGERRLADLLAECRTGKRCNLLECPKCERRREIAWRKVPADAVKTIGSLLHPIQNIRVNAIEVIGRRRPLQEDKLRAIAASMDFIGLQTPITVETRNKRVILISGSYRLSAAKRLAWRTIPCITLYRGKIHARMWQIVENLYRVELTALERAELTDELRQLVRQQVGQVAPPGGHQPEDRGINKTAEILGLTKEEIRRSRVIAGICPKAKDKVRKLGLDDNQRALLAIAKETTLEAQLRAVKEIVERKRAARDRRASAAVDKKTTAEINAIEADIRQKEDALTRLKAELASTRKRRREIDDKLAVQGDVADLAPPSEASSPDTAARSDNSPDVTAGVIEDVPSPAIMPTEEEDLDRSQLSAEDQVAYDAIRGAWKNHVQPLWDVASAIVHERFIAALRADMASANWAAE